jgi:hypothetical protein
MQVAWFYIWPILGSKTYQVNALSDSQKQGSAVWIFLEIRMYDSFSFCDGSLVSIIYHPLRPAPHEYILNNKVESSRVKSGRVESSRVEPIRIKSSRTLEMEKWRRRETQPGIEQSDLSETGMILVLFKGCKINNSTVMESLTCLCKIVCGEGGYVGWEKRFGCIQ